jgi:hypothetical protein
VLDHLLVQFIGSLRDAMDNVLLQRQAVEERFQVDVFLGDVSWETSYSLPGEEQPPRVAADVSIDWPTWSQTSYRSWSLGEPPGELPEALVEVALHVERLAEAPDLAAVLEALPAESPPIGAEPLTRTAVTLEQVREEHGDVGEYWAVEATYEGAVRFEEAQMEDPAAVDPATGTLARWIASVLVRLADMPLRFLPPEPGADSP